MVGGPSCKSLSKKLLKKEREKMKNDHFNKWDKRERDRDLMSAVNPMTFTTQAMRAVMITTIPSYLKFNSRFLNFRLKKMISLKKPVGGSP